MSPNEHAAGCSVNGLRQTRGTAGNQVRSSISKATTMTDEEVCLERADRLIREGVAGDRGLIASMIYEAVTSEREACARLMTSYARKDRDEKRVTAFADAEDAIRARSTTTV